MTQYLENIHILRALMESPGLDHLSGEGAACLGHAGADAALGGGIRRGALHEVFAAAAGEEAAATGFTLALGARLRTQNKGLLWVRQDFSALEAGELHGSGLLDLGIDPERLLIVRVPTPTDVLRAGAEGLACKGLGVVVLEPWGEPKAYDLVAARKLTLTAQQSGVTPIVLRFGARPEPSTAETRWLVKAAASSPSDEDWGRPLFDAALVRNRHGNTGRWIMEWDCHNELFRRPAAHSGALAAASSHGPAATPLEILRQTG